MSKNSQKWLMPFDVDNSFYFKSSPRDFIVEEIPLYPFSGDGEHLILQIRKRNLTTWEMVDLLSNHLGVKRREVGYAGLKDKNALTIQYISLPKKYEAKLRDFEHKDIKILSQTYHKNRLRVGHLKGNSFKLRFKRVLGVHRDKLESTLGWIAKNGLPNYFGSQRFGVNGDNFLEGKKIVEHQLKIRDRKAREFLISAYQSYLFNNWLSKRIELSRVLKSFSVDEVEQIFTLPKDSLAGVKNQQNFFKLLSGDVMMHYPFGRIFYLEDLAKESERFLAKDTAPTGLICGKKAKRAEGVASTFEKSFEDGKIAEQGGRRYAWIFPEDISSRYLPEKAHFELEFTLPKGSYATILVDFLRGRE